MIPIRDARQSIFVPTVCSGTGMIVGEIFPGVSVRAVVFAHRSPCAFAEVWPPALPMLLARCRFRQSDFFLRHADSPALSILSRHATSSENVCPLPGTTRSASVVCSDEPSRWGRESSRASSRENILSFSGAAWIMPRFILSSLFLLNFNSVSIWVSNNHSFGETELLSMIHNYARRNEADLCGR